MKISLIQIIGTQGYLRYRTLNKGLSLGVNFAFAGITKIEGQVNRNIRYFSSDLQVKYAFFYQKALRPYVRLGGGISSFNNV